MIFSDYIALIGDFCYYAATVGFVVRLCGNTASPLLLIVCYLLSITAFLLLRKVKNVLRFAPLLLLLPDFLCCGGSAAGLIWPIPLVVLLLLRAWSGSWSAEYARTRTIFKIALIVYVPFALFSLMSKRIDDFTSQSMPFFVAWLLITVIDLRILRTPDMQSLGTRFRVLNVLLVLAVAVLAFVLSSDVCVTVLRTGLSFLLGKVCAPLLMAVVYVCIAIPALIVFFVRWILSLFTGVDPKPSTEFVGNGEPDVFQEIYNSVQPGAWLGKVLSVLGILLIIFLCFLICRKLLARRNPIIGDLGTHIRESLGAPEPLRSKKRFSFSNSAEDTVRSSYRSYLAVCARHDVEVDGRIASDRICSSSVGFSGEENAEKLRSLWLPARYSELNITEEDAKEAKSLLKDIRAYAVKKDREK